eukprot:9530341-Alexandrium_andersonii.AAC.1
MAESTNFTRAQVLSSEGEGVKSMAALVTFAPAGRLMGMDLEDEGRFKTFLGAIAPLRWNPGEGGTGLFRANRASERLVRAGRRSQLSKTCSTQAVFQEPRG